MHANSLNFDGCFFTQSDLVRCVDFLRDFCVFLFCYSSGFCVFFAIFICFCLIDLDRFCNFYIIVKHLLLMVYQLFNFIFWLKLDQLSQNDDNIISHHCHHIISSMISFALNALIC